MKKYAVISEELRKQMLAANAGVSARKIVIEKLIQAGLDPISPNVDHGEELAKAQAEYDALFAQAADEAKGQGYDTKYPANASPIRGIFWWEEPEEG